MKLRGALVLVLVCCASACAVAREKFDVLDRAGGELRRSTTTSLTLEQYQRLVEAFSSELAAVKQKISNEQERLLAARFETALDAYTDALVMWRAQPVDGPIALPASMRQVITRRYWLTEGIPLSKALGIIWEQANQLLDDADRMLKGGDPK